MMKAIVSIVELATVALVLITTFALFFPRFAYVSRWGDALLLLKGRDAALTADRIGKLYEYSFNFSALSNFLGKIFPGEALIYLPATAGTIKSRLHIACNCTDLEKKVIVDWFRGPEGKAPLRINGRDIFFDVCTTHLEALNPCFTTETDVLIIFSDKVRNQHLGLLKGHLERGNGIIQIRDFPPPGIGSDERDVQEKIFGLKWHSVSYAGDYDEFSRKPASVADIVYGPWKYFFHIPINLEYSSSKSIHGCAYQPSAEINFTFNETLRKFWICDAMHVWLDSNGDGVEDMLIKIGNSFTLNNQNFILSYINGNASIGVSFKPPYKFRDFIRMPTPPGRYRITSVDDSMEKVLLFYESGGYNHSAAILNATPIWRVAWIANFTKNEVGDDERLLFISLLLWASNQREIWSKEIAEMVKYVKTIYPSSYINVENKDMFEVYEFKLGMGHPYR